MGIPLVFVLGGLAGYFVFWQVSRRAAHGAKPEGSWHGVYGNESNGARQHEADGAEIHQAP